MNAPSLKAGDRIKAFHPRMMGVVKEGTVERVGRSYLHVNFGSILGGTVQVPYAHFVEKIENA